MKPRVLYPAILSLLLTLCFSFVHEEGWGQSILPTSFSGPNWTTSLPAGWSQNGLGTDYSSSYDASGNAGKFDTQGDYLIINFNSKPGLLSYILKNNGGSTTYQFDVLESNDGTNYSTLKSHTNANNAIGTGTTGTSFTATAASTTRYIKFIYTTKPSGTNIGIDAVSIQNSAPTTQASSITFPTVGTSGMDISWTNGNGSSRAVFVKEGTQGTITNPSDGTTYTASNNWSSKGTQLGTSGYYCVYNGTGSSVSLTNLSSSTTYYVQVFEYNGSGATSKYMTSTATNNPNSQATNANTTPTITVGSLTAFGNQAVNTTSGEKTYNVFGSNLTADITVTAPSGFMVSKTSGSGFATSVAYTPTGGTVNSSPVYVIFEPTAEQAFSGNITHISGLADQKDVTVSGKGISTEPSSQASNPVTSAVQETQFTLSWDPGTGSSRLVLVKAGSAVDYTPLDGTSYSANSVFGTVGTQYGTGNYAVYSGTGSSVTITGLTASTTYHYSIYEFNGSGGFENYLTSTTSTGSQATANPPVGWQITATNSAFTIDFDNTVSGVNNGQFAGSGFKPTPDPGQLDSDAWAITGFSDGSLSFGGTRTSGDYTLGTSSGGVTSGGVYGFTISTGNRALGIQPTDNDWTPGTISLKLQNQTGTTITDILLSYKCYVLNNDGRSSYLEFSYSGDNSTFTPITMVDVNTLTTAEGGATWKNYQRIIKLSGISINSGDFYYLRWTGDDLGGSGSRDEFALDDITLKANPSGIAEISGTMEDLAFNGDVLLSGGLTVNKNLTLNTGTELILDGYDLILNGTITGSGTITGDDVAAISMTGTGTTTLNFTTGAQQLADLTINRTGTVTLGTNLKIEAFGGGGDLFLTNGTLAIGSATLTLNGDASITTGTITGGTSSSLVVGGSDINLSLPALTLNNFTLNRANGFTLGGNYTIGGLLTLTSGALSIGANTLTLNGDVVQTSGTLNGSTAASVIVGGSGDMLAMPGCTLGSFTLNRANGAELAGSLTVNTNLTLTSGGITYGANTLTMGDGATITRTGGSVAEGILFAGVVNVTYNQHTGIINAGPEFPNENVDGTLGNMTINNTNGVNLGSSPNQPWVNGTLSIGGPLTLGGKYLKLLGPVAYTAGTLDFTSGSVFYAQTAPVNILNTNYQYLYIGGTSLKTLDGNITASGALTINGSGVLQVNAGRQLTVNGNTTIDVPQGLVLKADASGMASFIDNGTINYNTGGSVTVERYSPANAVGYFSSPVSGATRNVFAGSVNSKLYEYNAGNGSWTSLTINTTELEAMRGYVAKFATNTTLSFTGQLYTADQLAGEPYKITLVNGGTYGWNLVGNTYPSALDVESAGFVMGTQIQPFVSMRKSDGNVGYYSKTSHLGNNGGSRYIPPTQAFWINLEAATDIGFSFSNTARVHTAQNIYKSFEEPEAFRLTVWKGTHSDELTVAFLDNAQETHEMYDADKLFINDTNFGMVYSVSADARNLAINGLPPLTGDRDVPLGFEALKAGNYSFSANVEALDPAIAVNLEDTEAGIMQDLRQNPEYNFTSGVVNTTSRFILHFHTTKVSGQVVYDHASTPWPVANAKVKLLNAAGDEVSSTTCYANGNFSFDMVPYGSRLQISTNLPGAGWNAADALEAMKHFTGLSTLGGLPLAAADVNGNGYVNSVDAMLIQKRFVSMISTFPAGEWVFEEKIFTPETAGNTETIQIKGLCVGDVNRSNQ